MEQNCSARPLVELGSPVPRGFSFFFGNSAALDGTLNIMLLISFVPDLGEAFEIMTFASRSGTFGTINGTSIAAGKRFDVIYGSTSVTLEVGTDP
jgi:hypothetical protein